MPTVNCPRLDSGFAAIWIAPLARNAIQNHRLSPVNESLRAGVAFFRSSEIGARDARLNPVHPVLEVDVVVVVADVVAEIERDVRPALRLDIELDGRAQIVAHARLDVPARIDVVLDDER